MTGTTSPRMTVAEFLALPEDRIDRDLIRGEVRERGAAHPKDRFHGSAAANISYLLADWNRQQPEFRGDIFSGGVGCILRQNPATVVSIDVAYFSAEVLARQTDENFLMEGPPILAVEILSPSDKQEDINEKVDSYLAAGVPLVWIVDPHFRTVLVHQPGGEPELFNIRQQLTAEPHLPGFRVDVRQIFE